MRANQMFGLTVQVAARGHPDARVTVRLSGSAKQRSHRRSRGMLFMHEVHTVRGRAEDDFEAAFRDGWMPTLGAGDEARLLWYANHAHGTGPAYTTASDVSLVTPVLTSA
jgi:hypothetical protein